MEYVLWGVLTVVVAVIGFLRLAEYWNQLNQLKGMNEYDE